MRNERLGEGRAKNGRRDGYNKHLLRCGKMEFRTLVLKVRKDEFNKRLGFY